MSRRALLALVLATVAAAAVAVAPARADGDPPSDVLLGQDVYFPYEAPPSRGAAKAIIELTRRARAAGFPIKVALIATTNDLGSVPSLFGQPQRYADFLAVELRRPRLLVVMPAGYGAHRLGPDAAATLAKLPRTPRGGDAFVRDAMDAVVAVAAANGHRLPKPAVDTSAAGRRPYRDAPAFHQGGAARPAAAPPATAQKNGPPALLVFGLPTALVVGALVVLTVRDRRRGPDEPGNGPESDADRPER